MIFVGKKPLEQVLQEQRNEMIAKDVIKKLVRQAFEEALRIDDEQYLEASKKGVKRSHFWDNSEIKKNMSRYLND
jgi:transposase-like protein